MSSGVDHQAADELELYMENEGSLYNQKKSIIANLLRKMQKGAYDKRLAPRLWLYWVDAGARKYLKEYGGGRLQDVFNKPTREALAEELAKKYERRMREFLKSGNEDW